jgi:hypothetical protein
MADLHRPDEERKDRKGREAWLLSEFVCVFSALGVQSVSRGGSEYGEEGH